MSLRRKGRFREYSFDKKGTTMKISNEAKIGGLVVIAIAMMAALTIKAGDFHFVETGYAIKVRFHQIDGLERSAPVRFNGLEAGQVSDIQVLYDEEGTQMELSLMLKENIKIRQGAKAFVKNMGLLGEKYVGLSDGDKG